MNFKNISSCYYPAYGWAWTTKINKDGIKSRIDDMWKQGIRAFYILAEPKEFRPLTMASNLEPEYLSQEYIDLVYYAYEYATKKGMYTWMYNEGGWPSGMACGQVVKECPELRRKAVYTRLLKLNANEPYVPSKNAIVAFYNETKIVQGYRPSKEIQITEYYYDVEEGVGKQINSDIGKRKTVEKFLELTHEKYKDRFGDAFGTNVKIMFDDEALIGGWSEGFEDVFYARYGYDIREYMPYIFRRAEMNLDTEIKRKVYFDYQDCREYLMRTNYLQPMREWLHRNGMLSGGHLCGEQWSLNLYANILAALREYDIPGIDVIWGQITYPNEEGRSVYMEDGYEFYPRLAHSAARQQGLNLALTESMGVYGEQTDPELMRFVVNFQAVRGINMFNFYIMSYANTGDGVFPLVYRCNYIPDNPSRDCLTQINEYTARLSYILQQGKPVINSALYFPNRSILAGGRNSWESIAEYERIGYQLEKIGVAFDIIDEEFVHDAEVKNGCLCGKYVSYHNVFVPICDYEPDDVKEKLSLLQGEYEPVCERKYEKTQARHLIFDDGSEAYFVCNTDGKTVTERLGFTCGKRFIYRIDLESGELFEIDYQTKDEKYYVSHTLLRGEGLMILFTDEKQCANKEVALSPLLELKSFRSFISRRYEVEEKTGIKNTYYESGEYSWDLKEWERDFSGEVTYEIKLPDIPATNVVLDLGEVRCVAKIYLNGNKIAESTMPPYRVPLAGAKGGDILKIVVANTAANAIRCSNFFDHQDPKYLGPYHARTLELEKNVPAGGLMGPVLLLVQSK